MCKSRGGTSDTPPSRQFSRSHSAHQFQVDSFTVYRAAQLSSTRLNVWLAVGLCMYNVLSISAFRLVLRYDENELCSVFPIQLGSTVKRKDGTNTTRCLTPKATRHRKLARNAAQTLVPCDVTAATSASCCWLYFVAVYQCVSLYAMY